jgi:hypothetical protein
MNDRINQTITLSLFYSMLSILEGLVYMLTYLDIIQLPKIWACVFMIFIAIVWMLESFLYERELKIIWSEQ